MNLMLSSLLHSMKVLVASVTAVAMMATPTMPALTNQAVSLDTSRNWSGYVAQGGQFTTVSGTWTIPTVQGGSNFSADATWVGIGGVSSHDLIQSGTQATIDRSGQVDYEAWLELLPRSQRILPLNVNAGDSVSVSIAKQSGSDWQISFVDNTSGQSYQTDVTYASTLSSADWIEEAPSMGGRRFIPLDNFGTVQFSAGMTTKDGQKLSIAEAGGKSVNMGQAGNILAQASNLGADGQSFSISRSETASEAQPEVQIITPNPGFSSRHRFIPRGNFY